MKLMLSEFQTGLVMDFENEIEIKMESAMHSTAERETATVLAKWTSKKLEI